MRPTPSPPVVSVFHLDLSHGLSEKLEHFGGRGRRRGGTSVKLDIPSDVGESALEQPNNLGRNVRNARPCSEVAWRRVTVTDRAARRGDGSRPRPKS